MLIIVSKTRCGHQVMLRSSNTDSAKAPNRSLMTISILLYTFQRAFLVPFQIEIVNYM